MKIEPYLFFQITFVPKPGAKCKYARELTSDVLITVRKYDICLASQK